VGLQALYGSSAKYDPSMKRELKEFIEESYQKGWQIRPSSAKQRIFFEMGGNILRRARGYDVLEKTFVKELDLLVTIDWRMSNTARHSDYVLPAAGWYEKDDILWATPLAPYIHIISRAVEPVGDSKSDWTIHCLIAKAIQRRAKERGVSTFTDRAGKERRLDRVYDEFTFQGKFHEDNPEAILEQVLENTSNLADIDWQGLKKKGFQRVTDLGMDFINIGNATDIAPDETITANTWHTDKKLPWPTLTRRIQSRTQGQPQVRRRLPAPAGRGSHSLVDPLRLARQPAAAAYRRARGADDLDRERGCGCAGYSRQRSRQSLQRHQRVRDVGEGRAQPAAGPGHHLPRVGAIPVQGREVVWHADPEPDQPAFAGRGLLAPAAASGGEYARADGSRYAGRGGEGRGCVAVPRLMKFWTEGVAAATLELRNVMRGSSGRRRLTIPLVGADSIVRRPGTLRVLGRQRGPDAVCFLSAREPRRLSIL